MKVNKENITKLLKNKYFYLGIFGFIFLIIIIITFSGGKKPDESECAADKIRDAEGDCYADGSNKTSICRENCEANTNNKTVWDCVEKKCKCKKGTTECGTSGICCMEGECNIETNLCCNPLTVYTDPTDHKKKCCGGGQIANNTGNGCIFTCGSDTNICSSSESCFRLVDFDDNDKKSIIETYPNNYSIIDNKAYFCTNNNTDGKYDNTPTFYPNAVKGEYLCMSLHDIKDDIGFCTGKTSTDDKKCFVNSGKTICQSKNNCEWRTFWDEKKTSKTDLDDLWKTYYESNSTLDKTYLGEYCNGDAPGSRITKPEYNGTKPNFIECLKSTAYKNTTFRNYDKNTGSCISLQSCNNDTNKTNMTAEPKTILQIMDNNNGIFTDLVKTDPTTVKTDLYSSSNNKQFGNKNCNDSIICPSVFDSQNYICEKPNVFSINKQNMYSYDNSIHICVTPCVGSTCYTNENDCYNSEGNFTIIKYDKQYFVKTHFTLTNVYGNLVLWNKDSDFFLTHLQSVSTSPCCYTDIVFKPLVPSSRNYIIENELFTMTAGGLSLSFNSINGLISYYSNQDSNDTFLFKKVSPDTYPYISTNTECQLYVYYNNNNYPIYLKKDDDNMYRENCSAGPGCVGSLKNYNRLTIFETIFTVTFSMIKL